MAPNFAQILISVPLLALAFLFISVKPALAEIV
jgi:hypothetical protein